MPNPTYKALIDLLNPSFTAEAPRLTKVLTLKQFSSPMSQSMRFSTAGEPASLAEVCKLSWHTFYGMQKASEDFENLRFEVWTIAISLDSLHSVGTTSILIDRQPDKARWALTFSKILTSLGAVLRPLHSLVKLYLSSSSKDRASIKNWLTHSEVAFEGLTIQDFRRKLSMLVESLNVFLSCLTHAELARAKAAFESEEYRVLSEVTRNVLHKWDQDVTSGVRRPTERGVTQPVEAVGYVNNNDNSNPPPKYILSSPNSGVSGLGLAFPDLPSSPARPRCQNERPSQRPASILNLDDIEQGFRSHMHAMRRIREQLRKQKTNNDHLSDQKSVHFPEASNSTGSQRWGQPPLTPTTPVLNRNMVDSTQSSDVSGDYADASSNGGSSLQSSETGSVASSYQNPGEEDSKMTVTTRLQSSPGHHLRKRKRRSQYRFRTGLEDEKLHSSDDDDGSDDVFDAQQPHVKTELEKILTTVLFFDQ
ncbi:uncharacterized protein Z518_08859 [Rhinocladiella mackenziei CBS 650.93]|uniref:Uncharacterized protein n=1 Tax=Rhinocladiella mackenziei CBS 650.93 TaxID=1442369 RepID=A0A0D2II09_9EURO|nr:uncharacterized protein Z518_08859 [Rhinocladiella mackenziei CBS 650.93]KIX02916.1 hypothetical protein Z518_08859 [Rhinocladiella mackenziei CBS 650.93]